MNRASIILAPVKRKSGTFSHNNIGRSARPLTEPSDGHTATLPTDAHATATLLTPYLPRRLTAPAWRQREERSGGGREGGQPMIPQPGIQQLETQTMSEAKGGDGLVTMALGLPSLTVKFADDKLSL